MSKIAIFDSGYGSLSIIMSIQKHLRLNLIYFADQKNYPYGTKKKNDLRKIINKTIDGLNQKFSPDLIIIASNTPSILFGEKISKNTIGILPPLKKAARIARKTKIAILVTSSVSSSTELRNFTRSQLGKDARVRIVNVSFMVDLVETGKFLDKVDFCKKMIKKNLTKELENVKVATLSSTHLPFLREILEEIFPGVTFLDPAEDLVKKISAMKNLEQSTRSRLVVYSSKNPKLLESNIKKLGLKNKVKHLSF